MAGTVANDILPLRIEFFKNSEWVHEPKAIIPLRWTKQLNEALDVVEFIIMKTTESEPIPPFTKMRIIEGANDEQITYWYASSQVELVTKMPPYYYKHYVAFVEPTKILETITTGGELLTQSTTGTKKSMYDYFDTLLAVNPLRTEWYTDKQEITIDPALANYLKGIEAREFTTNHNTLYEAIMEGAQYIHALPRMTDYNTLSFDFLGEVKEYLENDKYFTWRKGQNPNEYCTALEVQAQNVLDTDKTMWYPTPPGIDLGVTVRSETVDLSLDTAEIILPFPIYEIKHVWVWGFALRYQGILPAVEETYYTEAEAWHLTPDFILEAEAYKSLSNYGDGKDSQSAHWYYTRYDNKIKGFNQRGYGIIPERFQYAWANLLIQEYNKNLHSGQHRVDRVLTKEQKEAQIQDLKFKVEYVPVSNPRFRQEYIGKGRPQTAVSFDNQSQNLVDIKSFGENLRGKVARFGNKAIEKTTVYKNYADIPKVGTAQIVNGETYILEVQALEFKNTYYKATNTFTKDFSRISAYIGLNQQRREYELPTSLVADRKLYFGVYFYISLNPDYNNLGGETGVTLNGLYMLLQNAFNAYIRANTWETTGHLCSATFVATRKKDRSLIGVYMLPTTCKMVGKSLLFEFGFANNLSAGKKLEGQWANEKNASLNIPYCDENGEIEYCDLCIAPNLKKTLSVDSALTRAISADSLPYIGNDEMIAAAARVNDSFALFHAPYNQWIVKKDARNNLQFNYQVHFIGLDGLVIGQSLIRSAAIINETGYGQLKCIVLQNEIDTLRTIIDSTKATTVNFTLRVDDIGQYVYTLIFNSPVKAKAWALLSSANEFFIGGNTNIEEGEKVIRMYFSTSKERLN